MVNDHAWQTISRTHSWPTSPAGAGRGAGVRYRTADGDHEVRALLTVGADGRQSLTRDAVGLPRVSASPPMDVLWKPLREGAVPLLRDLAAVQRRREVTLRATQAMQEFMHRQLLAPTLASSREPVIPPLLRLAMRAPGLRALMPRLVALGVNRPHVQSPALAGGATPSPEPLRRAE